MAEIETVVEPNGVGDDVGRKSVAFIDSHHRIIPFLGLNLSVPSAHEIGKEIDKNDPDRIAKDAVKGVGTGALKSLER